MAGGVLQGVSPTISFKKAGGGNWGEITGEITDQTDLVEYVASAGLNIDGGNAESFTEDLIIYADGGNA